MSNKKIKVIPHQFVPFRYKISKEILDNHKALESAEEEFKKELKEEIDFQGKQTVYICHDFMEECYYLTAISTNYNGDEIGLWGLQEACNGNHNNNHLNDPIMDDGQDV